MKSSKHFVRQSQASLAERYRMIGESEAFLDCMQRVSLAAKVDRPVLIIGERGTGKELVAARLHFLSTRWQHPKISINCAAFSPDLLESEIFGYEQGAFTGAVRTKPGRLELADKGSLFLDELAQSPMPLQEKLLRAIEYQEIERVGGVNTISLDVRIIAATNQDLPSLCELGKFREDLLDRLSFEVITLPPLRHRKEDIPMLVVTFASAMARELELTQMPVFTDAALEQLLDYDWPGNIRELKNTVERAVYRGIGAPIKEITLDPFESPFRPKRGIGRLNAKPTQSGSELTQAEDDVLQSEPELEASDFEDLSPGPEPGTDLPRAIENLEREMVSAALKACQFNQKKAADSLGVSYYQLRRIIKRIEL